MNDATPPLPPVAAKKPSSVTHHGITIADDYQGRGLGSRLARRAVADHLRTHECVSFSILPGNTSAARMARGHGLKLKFDQGTLDGVVQRPAEMPYEFRLREVLPAALTEPRRVA